MQRHDQLVAELRTRVAGGSWRAGQSIPGRRTLAQEYGVALATIERAISVLMAEGLLRADSRRATFVTDAVQVESQGQARPAGARRGSLNASVALVAGMIPFDSSDMRLGQWTARVLAGCEHALAAEPGVDQHVHNIIPGPGQDLTPAQMAAQVASDDCDAIVLIGGAGDAMAQALSAIGLPMMVAAYDPAPVPITQVYMDGSAGGALAARHLLSRGYRKLVYLRPFNANWVDLRQQGALAEGPINVVRNPAPPDHDVPSESSQAELATSLAHQFLDAGFESGMGIIAPNDAIAVAFIAAARKRGLTAGEDFGIIGFDDRESAHALTSLRPPLTELGEEVGRNMLRLLRGETYPSRTALPHCLIPRRSTAGWRHGSGRT